MKNITNVGKRNGLNVTIVIKIEVKKGSVIEQGIETELIGIDIGKEIEIARKIEKGMIGIETGIETEITTEGTENDREMRTDDPKGERT